jgi:hypothetical protein
MTESLIRYLAVVSSTGVQDTEESVIVGVDIMHQEATIGLVQPIWADMAIKLDGDGYTHMIVFHLYLQFPNMKSILDSANMGFGYYVTVLFTVS